MASQSGKSVTEFIPEINSDLEQTFEEINVNKHQQICDKYQQRIKQLLKQ